MSHRHLAGALSHFISCDWMGIQLTDGWPRFLAVQVSFLPIPGDTQGLAGSHIMTTHGGRSAQEQVCVAVLLAAPGPQARPLPSPNSASLPLQPCLHLKQT